MTIISLSTGERSSTAFDGRLVMGASMDVVVALVRGSMFSTLKRSSTLV